MYFDRQEQKKLVFHYKGFRHQEVDWQVDMVLTLEEGKHYMRKYLEITVPDSQRHLAPDPHGNTNISTAFRLFLPHATSRCLNHLRVRTGPPKLVKLCIHKLLNVTINAI